jgi:hypothetical protein
MIYHLLELRQAGNVRVATEHWFQDADLFLMLGGIPDNFGWSNSFCSLRNLGSHLFSPTSASVVGTMSAQGGARERAAARSLRRPRVFIAYLICI